VLWVSMAISEAKQSFCPEIIHLEIAASLALLAKTEFLLDSSSSRDSGDTIWLL